MKLVRIVCAGVAAALTLGGRARAGMTFVFTPSDGTPQAVTDAFKAAGQRWAANFTNNVTIRIDIDYALLSSGALAQTGSATGFQQYSAVRSALSALATSADDRSAVAKLATGTSFKMLINHTAENPNGAGSATPYVDSSTGGFLSNNRWLSVTQANMKVLGLASSGNSDATITVNSSYTYDYNPRDGITYGQYDLVGLAAHEIGHALGFSSGVDRLDAMINPSNPPAENDLRGVTTLDLFRYSTQSTAEGVIDWTADTRDKYLSVDGGQTSLGRFSTGTSAGDKHQASHWKDNLNLGIMDPTWSWGTTLHMSDLDRRAMDILGYKLNTAWRWSEGAGGTWNQPLLWDADGVPTSDVDAMFLEAGTYTVNFTAAAAAKSLRVGAGAVTFKLNGNTLAVGSAITVGEAPGGTVVWTMNGPGRVAGPLMYVGGGATASGVASAVTLGSGATLELSDTLKIWDVGGTSFTNSGGTLKAASIQNAARFEHASGTLSVSGTFRNLGGIAIFSGTQDWGPDSALVVSGGRAVLNSDAGSAASANLALAVQTGGTTEIYATQHLHSLAVPGGRVTMSSGGDKVLVTGALSVDQGGQVDVNDNGLIVQSDPAGRMAAYDNVVAMIQSGRNGGAWDGSGLVSSAAVQGPVMSLGAILNDRGGGVPLHSAFLGQAVDASSVLVRYTWVGDTDLNGMLDADDYFRLDQGFIRGLRGWRNGDFDYNGVVNADDYRGIDAAFKAQAAMNLATFNAVAMGPGAGILSVPEPGAMSAVLGLGLLLARRRAPRLQHGHRRSAR